jgi:hypothetical protein
MRKDLNGVWCNMLGNVAEEVTFLIHLRRNVLDTYLGHVDAVRILHSTWPGNNPRLQTYAITMAFRLAMAGSGWNLKRDTLMNDNLGRISQRRKLNRAFCSAWS